MFQAIPKDNVRAVRFDYVKSVIPKPLAGAWVQLACRLCISKENYRKDRRALWSPVIYKPDTTRANRNIDAVTCLVVDMDGEAFDHARLDGLEWLAYTTWSHREDNQHWHLVLPLKHPVPAERWSEVWTRLHERINVVGDPATKDPARIFYLPQHQPGQAPQRREGYGEFLDAELGELFVPGKFSSTPTVRKLPPRKRVDRYWESESWWNERQDLSRFAGLTQTQIAERLLAEFQDLKKSLSFN